MRDPLDDAKGAQPKAREIQRPTPPKAGDICPNCGFALLREESRGHVRCPICGFSTAPPCT
ncbi:MAG: hypothetical protein M0Z66_13335 [Thermaerobacter sp.]|nr:hypothetical protein [Thermaerobacter sp.]